MTTPAQYLTAVRQRLEKPEAWTQDEYARDAEGCGVFVADPNACAWCLEGAMIAARQTLGVSLGWCLAYIDPPISDRVGDYVAWNDDLNRTHDDILNLLDELIAEATNGR